MLSPTSFDFILRFLRDFISSYGEPHPGKKNKILLPSVMSRNNIYIMYCNAVTEINKNQIELE
jgi:hypothetical protein